MQAQAQDPQSLPIVVFKGKSPDEPNRDHADDLARALQAVGEKVHTVDTDSGDVALQGLTALPGIKAAFGFNGTGLATGVDGESIWDKYRIPFFCIFTRHPLLCPLTAAPAMAFYIMDTPFNLNTLAERLFPAHNLLTVPMGVNFPDFDPNQPRDIDVLYWTSDISDLDVPWPLDRAYVQLLAHSISPTNKDWLAMALETEKSMLRRYAPNHQATALRLATVKAAQIQQGRVREAMDALVMHGQPGLNVRRVSGETSYSQFRTLCARSNYVVCEQFRHPQVPTVLALTAVANGAVPLREFTLHHEQCPYGSVPIHRLAKAHRTQSYYEYAKDRHSWESLVNRFLALLP